MRQESCRPSVCKLNRMAQFEQNRDTLPLPTSLEVVHLCSRASPFGSGDPKYDLIIWLCQGDHIVGTEPQSDIKGRYSTQLDRELRQLTVPLCSQFPLSQAAQKRI